MMPSLASRVGSNVIGRKRIMQARAQSSDWGPLIEGIEVVRVVGALRPPSSLKGTPLVAAVDEAFRTVLETSDRLSEALARLERAEVRYCVFGGWLRDTLSARLRGTPPPRDVDLVIADLEVGTLLDILPADVQPTIFGGIQSSASPVPFDLWPLHDTFLIRSQQLSPSFESLLRTTDFNINAALYFPTQGGVASSICDAGMLAALDSEQIAFNSSDLPLPIIQCARLAAYAVKLRFGFAPEVLDFMQEVLANPSNREKVVAGLECHQSKPVADAAVAIVRSFAEVGS
jgi:hypothetical protein